MAKFLIFLFSFQIMASSDDLLRNYCDRFGGKVQKTYTCPKSKLKLNFGFCIFKNEQGIEQFFDGCTGPDGGHTDLFYPHCIAHDLCYHHEPVSNDMSRKDCDLRFKNGLLQSCESADNQKRCVRWAKTMYRALRIFGNIAFHCANYKAAYSTSVH